MILQADGEAQPLAGHDVFAGTPYRLVRRLGGGRMGDVFLVEHRELGREMVAKLLLRSLGDDARLLDRVRLEATTLARLNHPNVVQISDFRRIADGRPFLIMERLSGRTLKDELAERGALSTFDALDFAHQALSGLGAAHALGVVHRDVTPEHLFLARDRDGLLTLKVLDFGLALVLPSAPREAPQPLSLPTSSGTLIGTPRYLSPEAVAGARVDRRADLYAVALILYEMVAGRGPFDHLQRKSLAAQRAVAAEPPSRLAQHPVPTEFDAVIQRGLAKDPRDRFQSAQDFQRELERLWQLIHQSHALATTYFSHQLQSPPRTTGQLPRQLAGAGASVVSASAQTSAATPALVGGSVALTSVAAARRGNRSWLVVLALAVALVTALAVSSGIVLLLAQASP
jgi:eukaryotic-like serine/threonine-protein kinase